MTGLKLEVFFLISQKLFVKAWHNGIIYKPKQNDSSSKLLSVLSDFTR